MSKPTREQRERWRKLSAEIGEWRNKYKGKLDAEFKQLTDILKLMIKIKYLLMWLYIKLLKNMMSLNQQ